MPKKSKNNYVDNQALYQAIVEHQQKIKDAEAAGLDKPRVSEYIGKCLYLIAENFSHKGSYRYYPFREEMVMEAVENCLKYMHNFNTEKYKNPHAYFTFVSQRTFWRYIEKEKDYLYNKYKNIERVNLFENATDRQMHDEYSKFATNDEIYQSEGTQDNMNAFIESYEQRKREKRLKKQEKKNETS